MTAEVIGSSVTHLLYAGMMLHALGTREAIIQTINDNLDEGKALFDLQCLGQDGSVIDMTFSAFGTFIVMDSHKWEGPTPKFGEIPATFDSPEATL